MGVRIGTVSSVSSILVFSISSVSSISSCTVADCWDTTCQIFEERHKRIVRRIACCREYVLW